MQRAVPSANTASSSPRRVNSTSRTRPPSGMTDQILPITAWSRSWGDRGDDPIVWELAAFIGATNEDEQVDLVTLMWFGRGDGGLQDWDELRRGCARAQSTHGSLPPQDAASARLSGRRSRRVRRSCEDFERKHLG